MGDGIASNKLECIPQKNLTSEEKMQAYASATNGKQSLGGGSTKKNAKQMFRKCLFKVTNFKKYHYQNQLS